MPQLAHCFPVHSLKPFTLSHWILWLQFRLHANYWRNSMCSSHVTSIGIDPVLNYLICSSLRVLANPQTDSTPQVWNCVKRRAWKKEVGLDKSQNLYFMYSTLCFPVEAWKQDDVMLRKASCPSRNYCACGVEVHAYAVHNVPVFSFSLPLEIPCSSKFRTQWLAKTFL